MIRLSAFADEISPDLDEQIAVLQSENIHQVDLRGAWGTNVLDLTDQQVATIKQALASGGIGVAAIGSPLGKVPIDGSFDEQLQRFARALTLAREFQTPYVRIFSFYPPASQAAAPVDYRDEVLRRMREMTDRARAADVVLLHENERGIYGDTIARCVDLMGSVDDAHFQAVLDPANFVVCGQVPYPDAYDALCSWVRYIHVKDVRADGALAPAGEGVARWPDLLQRLRQDGYDGVLSLEPHLAEAGQYQGVSGPDLFRRASQALQLLLRALDWEYA
jgi:sugar phosphate isomerase/epimerase